MESTPARPAHLAPHGVVVLRVCLAFVALGLLSGSFWYAFAGLILTVVVITMDALDGYLARRLGVASELGALIDITADRIVEHVFWIYFATVHLVGVWVPIVVVTRSFLVDTARSVAFSKGKTPFGEKTMMRAGITHFLVASRFSRSLYGVAKVAAFVVLGAVMVVAKGEESGALSLLPEWRSGLDVVRIALVYLTVGLCVIRGLPVLVDSRELLLAKEYPIEVRGE